jgi:hypothetical protein
MLNCNLQRVIKQRRFPDNDFVVRSQELSIQAVAVTPDQSGIVCGTTNAAENQNGSDWQNGFDHGVHLREESLLQVLDFARSAGTR